MFQEPSCADGEGEGRACTEDEEYFIVVCDFRNPLAQMEKEKGEHVQKMKSTLLFCVCFRNPLAQMEEEKGEHVQKMKSTLLLCVCFRNPLAQMEEEKREHVQKMKKMEAEMEQVFEMKVKEKKQKLKDSEADVSNEYVAHSTTYLCHEKGRRSLQSIRH